MSTTVRDLDVAATEVEAALASEAAFRQWYDRTLPRVYGYLVSRTGDPDLAEDLTQQAYVAAIDERWRFDGRADGVTWLCSIARHKLADHFRRLEREGRRNDRVAVREIDMPPPDGWRAVEDRELILHALRALAPAQRAVLLFVDLDGLSVAEAGRLIGRSHSSAQSLLFRARTAFRTAYGQEVPGD